MNISWVTLRDLEYVLAVAEHRHFGKAAESCHVSQPALSAQIKKIEDYLGVSLFERSNRRVSITPIGQGVIQQAHIVLTEAKKIEGIVRGKKEVLSGTFRLGAIATLGPYFMPYLLGPLRKKYRKMKLLLREGLTEDLIQELRAGALDAVLASPTFSPDGLRAVDLFIEPFLVAAPKGHPLMTKERLLSSDLRSVEMVLLEDGHCLKDQTLEICPANRRGQIRQFHATSLETLRQLVAAGHGYTLIPKLAVFDDPKLKSLVSYRSIDGKPVGRTIALYCRDRFTAMTDIDQLVTLIKDSLPPGLHHC